MSFVIGIVIQLAILAAIVAGIVALVRRFGGGEQRVESTPGAVRRFVVYGFAVGVLVLAAVGVAQTVALLIPEGERLVDRGSGEIAAALAMTIVGVPTFLGLWRWLSGRLATDPQERSSLGWGIFVAATNAIFLIGGLTGLGNGIAWLAGANSSGRVSLAFGITWTLIWVWVWRLGTGETRPLHLRRIPATLGSGVGLAVGAGSAIYLLGLVLGSAYDRLFSVTMGETGLGDDLINAIIWLALGGAVWWWHWLRHASAEAEAALPRVYLLVVGVLGGTITALASAGVVLFAVLQWFFGEPSAATAAAHFEPLPTALAAIAVGVAVWRYHRLVVAADPSVFRTEVGRAYRYLLAGTGLIAAASGFGVVVNALLGVLVEPGIDRGGSIDVLLGGITALIIGVPVWWQTWTPMERRRADDPAEARSVARRVYLTVLAGVGGLVAIISLIVLLFQLIEGILEGNRVTAIIDAIRTPFGLVTATAVVAGYHLAIWRRDRDLTVELEVGPELKRVFLVAGDPSADEVAKILGVPVTPWPRADEDGSVDPHRIAEALEGVEAERVIVIVSADRIEVIPLR